MRLRLRQPQVSKHLRVLSDAGLVDVRPVAQQRIYELRPEPFDELDTWLETFRRSMTDRMDRLEVLISERKSKKERRSEEHTSELQSPCNIVCRLLLEKKKARI